MRDFSAYVNKSIEREIHRKFGLNAVHLVERWKKTAPTAHKFTNYAKIESSYRIKGVNRKNS